MSVLMIHMTYQCNAKCDHCWVGCDMSPHSVIDPDLAMGCVRTLKEHNDLDFVILLGGEPGLFPKLTHRLVSGVHGLGLATRVETNAFYATSDEDAVEFLGPLYANSCSTMFSLDAYHEPFVSPDCVERAVRVAERLGGQYNLFTTYVIGPGSDHWMDRRNDELLAEIEERLGREKSNIWKGQMLFTGRSAEMIAPQVAKGRGVPRDACVAVPWWGETGSLETLGLLILDSEGYLTKGCGIALGNIKDRPTLDIIRSFNARQHPIFSVLMEQGPYGLAKMAADMGYQIKEDYADKCHLCHEAREVLHLSYPEYVVPMERYRQNG